MALLRWYGSPGFFDSGLQVICIVGSGVSHLPIPLYGVQVRRRESKTLNSSSGSLPSQQSSPLLWFQRTRDTQNLYCRDGH